MGIGYSLNFAVCLGFVLRGFLKPSERPQKNTKKKKVAVLCNAEKNSIKRI
jgi:hypothetical protein